MPKYLTNDEELISIGTFLKRAGYLKNRLTFGIAGLKDRNYYLGITNKRIIVLPLNYWTNSVEEKNIYSINHKDVEIRKNHLYIPSPGSKNNIELRFQFGIKEVSGLDKNEFINAIYSFKSKSQSITQP